MQQREVSSGFCEKTATWWTWEDAVHESHVKVSPYLDVAGPFLNATLQPLCSPHYGHVGGSGKLWRLKRRRGAEGVHRC